MKFKESVVQTRSRILSWQTLPLVLFAITMLAYGAHLPWMGFYWDDWPWVWFSHVIGPGGMRLIDIEHRPITGIILWVGALLAGEDPLGWQIYNLIGRFLGAVALAWMLRQIWPGRKNALVWVSLLFLVYPGFGQQYVAVNNSRHIYPLVSLFVSFGLMARAQSQQRHYWRHTAAGLGLSVLTMFATEYYYGFEILRPVVVWLILLRQNPQKRLPLVAVLKAWLPYLIPLAAVFIWRYLVAQSVNYAITIFDALGPASQLTLWDYAGFYLQDIFGAALGGWLKIFQLPDAQTFGSRNLLYFWGFVGLGAALSLAYTLFLGADPANRRWGWGSLLLGWAALLVGPLPFWVTNLDPRLSFPGDRLLLPSILGTCWVIVGLFDLLIPSKTIKAIVVSALVGLAVGAQYQTSLDYRLDWERQKATLQQLSWRIPALAPGTAILSNEFPAEYATDNSFMAPINWMYAPDFAGGNLPVYHYYFDLRFGANRRTLSAEIPFQEEYRFFPFAGRPADSVVIYHRLPGCLRVLTDRDRLDPDLPPDLRAILPFSNPARILGDATASAPLPAMLAAGSAPQNWCYFYQKADLALQRGDWAAAADFADRAFEAGFSDAPAKHAAEYPVLIEAYARTGQWAQAETITLAAFWADERFGPLFCETWERIQAETPGSAEQIFVKLGCE